MIAGMIRDFEGALARLEAGRLRVRQPPLKGLYRMRAGHFFHPTPEFFLQTGGGTDFRCPGQDFRLQVNEVCVMPSGVPHSETPVDLRTPYEILVCMHTRGGFIIQRARTTPQRVIRAVEVEHLASPRGQRAFRYLEELAEPAPERHTRRFRAGLLELFLLTLLGELHRPSAGKASRSPRVAEAEKLALMELSNPDLSVAQLAVALGCSADYLSRRFHEERGVTLVQWITRERVAMAREQLADLRRTVAEVGWACGFASPSYFIRVFREQTGLTPNAWREGR